MTKLHALKLSVAAFVLTALGAASAAAQPACLVPKEVERWKADYERQMMVRDHSGSTYEIHFRAGPSCHTTKLSSAYMFSKANQGACVVSGDEVLLFRGTNDDFTASCQIDSINNRGHLDSEWLTAAYER